MRASPFIFAFICAVFYLNNTSLIYKKFYVNLHWKILNIGKSLMENKMNKFGLKRLLAVLAVAFACVCMWGCGFEDGTHKEWMYRDAKKVVGFLDDSLVIVGDVRRWREVSDEDGDVVGLGAWGHQALYLFNYRVRENGPRWMDSLDNGFESDFEYFRGQLSDSIIWGGRWFKLY